MEPGPLEEATIPELVDELGKRCNHVVVAYDIDCKGEPDMSERFCVYRGGYTGAMGMALFAEAYLRQRLVTGQKPAPEED